MGTTVIGLDVGAAGVKAAWVKRDGRGGYTVVGTAYTPLPKGWVEAGAALEGDGFDHAPLVSDTIAQLWARNKIPSTLVAMAVSDPRSVFVTQALVPWVPPNFFDKAMSAHIRHQKISGVDPDDADIDTIVLGEVMVDDLRKLRVLVCAAVSVRTERLTSIAADAGLSVHSVQVASIATMRGLPVMTSRDASLADVIVDVGASQVSVMIHHGGIPLHVAVRIRIGGDNASEAVMTDLSMDSESKAEAAKKSAVLGSSIADALYAPAKLIAKFIRESIEEFAQISADTHAKSLEGVGSITLVGGGGRLFGLAEAVKRAISEEIEVYAGPWLTGDPADDSPDFTLAVGLAAGALPPTSVKAEKPVPTKTVKLNRQAQKAHDMHAQRADPTELMFEKAER